MSGAIIPEPFDIPQIVTRLFPILDWAAAPLGKVSVVMIALAASSQPPGFAFFTNRGTALSNLSTGSGSPITPVEDTKTFFLSSICSPRCIRSLEVWRGPT